MDSCLSWEVQLNEVLEGICAAFQLGATWHVAIHKGHKVVNKTGQALLVLRGHAASDSPAVCTDMMLLEPQEVNS